MSSILNHLLLMNLVFQNVLESLFSTILFRLMRINSHLFYGNNHRILRQIQLAHLRLGFLIIQGICKIISHVLINEIPFKLIFIFQFI